MGKVTDPHSEGIPEIPVGSQVVTERQIGDLYYSNQIPNN